MSDRFTGRAVKIMRLANQAACRMNHEYIGTEHILIGFLKEDSGVAIGLLGDCVSKSDLLNVIEKLVVCGPDMVTMGKLPQTPRAKKVIEYAVKEAVSMGCGYVGFEHIFLGLILEEEGVAGILLKQFGVTADAVRQKLPPPPRQLHESDLGNSFSVSIKSLENHFKTLQDELSESERLRKMHEQKHIDDVRLIDRFRDIFVKHFDMDIGLTIVPAYVEGAIREKLEVKLTETKPIETGWYWFLPNGLSPMLGSNATIRQVEELAFRESDIQAENLCVRFTQGVFLVSDMGGLWSEKLKEPEE